MSVSVATDPLMAATDLCERMGATVVMTLGGQGCVVVSTDASLELRAHSVPVVDTVGAGDAFCELAETAEQLVVAAHDRDRSVTP